MNILELFLRDHASVHTAAVAGSDLAIDWLLDGLTDDQWRAMPGGLNSLAWLFWHIARVEDSCLTAIVIGADPTLDDATADWSARLGVDRRDDGSAMTKADVAGLSAAISIPDLLEYRGTVGRRTRELVPQLWPDRWDEPLDGADTERGVAAGVLDADDSDFLAGKTREQFLWWWGVHHSIYHLGQAAMVRARVLASGE